MNNKKPISAHIIMAVTIAIFVAAPIYAQQQKNVVSHKVSLTVPDIAVLGMDASQPIDLLLIPPAAKYMIPSGRDRGTITLHYTTVNDAGAVRCINVYCDGDVPAGTALKLMAVSIPPGCGKAAPEVTIGSIPRCIISDIPSCATGMGEKGAVFQYRFVVEDESFIASGSKAELTVIYMITDS